MWTGLGADALEDRKMGLLTSSFRCVRNSVSPTPMWVAIVALATTLGFANTPNQETVQATLFQAGNTIGVTLIVYNYSPSSDLQVLSQAFQAGQDRELATALSKTKAVGRCLISGSLGYDVAFIQMVLTPTGRQIIFIASRPHPTDVSDPPAMSPSFDLAIGQFDLNDADPAKSSGFLFPASKLVSDEQGAFHYDLTGVPWALVNVFDSNGTPPIAESRVADTTGPGLGKDRLLSGGH